MSVSLKFDDLPENYHLHVHHMICMNQLQKKAALLVKMHL